MRPLELSEGPNGLAIHRRKETIRTFKLGCPCPVDTPSNLAARHLTCSGWRRDSARWRDDVARGEVKSQSRVQRLKMAVAL